MKVKEVVKIIYQVESKVDIAEIDSHEVIYKGTLGNVPAGLKERDVWRIIALPGENGFPYIRIYVEE